MSSNKTAKEEVLKVYPYAVCEKEPLIPHTRRSGLYFVKMKPNGPVIAGGHNAAMAWRLSLKKLQEAELKEKK